MTHILKRSSIVFLLACSLFISACTDTDTVDEDEMEDMAEEAMEEEAMTDQAMTMKTAMAMLTPTEGNTVSGTVTFTQTDAGVRVEADLSGLTPGEHGFHVHENGDCSDNGQAAGGHFDPAGNPHGAPDDAQRHAGDLGNIEADANGNAVYNRVDNVLALNGPNSIIGKAFIVHAGTDDLTSQPTGDAGGRVACGIIETEMDGE